MSGAELETEPLGVYWRPHDEMWDDPANGNGETTFEDQGIVFRFQQKVSESDAPLEEPQVEEDPVDAIEEDSASASKETLTRKTDMFFGEILKEWRSQSHSNKAAVCGFFNMSVDMDASKDKQTQQFAKAVRESDEAEHVLYALKNY